MTWTSDAGEVADVRGDMPGRPRMVCLGDSITYGDTGLGYRAERPWPEQVAGALGLDVSNCGHCGAATIDYRCFVQWRTARRTLPGAALVTLGLGTNDIDLYAQRSDAQVRGIAERTEHLADEALSIASPAYDRRDASDDAGIVSVTGTADDALAAGVRSPRGPAPRMVVLSVPQFALDEPVMDRFTVEVLCDMNRAVGRLNALYRTMCERRGWVFADYAQAVDQRRELFGNTIHPNQRGYDVIAGFLTPCLAAVLDGR